jgi:hypothetical protein
VSGRWHAVSESGFVRRVISRMNRLTFLHALPFAKRSKENVGYVSFTYFPAGILPRVSQARLIHTLGT